MKGDEKFRKEGRNLHNITKQNEFLHQRNWLMKLVEINDEVSQ